MCALDESIYTPSRLPRNHIQTPFAPNLTVINQPWIPASLAVRAQRTVKPINPGLPAPRLQSLSTQTASHEHTPFFFHHDHTIFLAAAPGPRITNPRKPDMDDHSRFAGGAARRRRRGLTLSGFICLFGAGRAGGGGGGGGFVIKGSAVPRIGNRWIEMEEEGP